MWDSFVYAYPCPTSHNVTFSYAHDRPLTGLGRSESAWGLSANRGSRSGRVTTEQISHGSYDYQAQVATVAYGAATAINTYPTVGGVAFTYVDPANINPNQLRSDGAIHQAAPWNYRYDGHGNLRNTASLNYQNQTSDYVDALKARWGGARAPRR